MKILATAGLLFVLAGIASAKCGIGRIDVTGEVANSQPGMKAKLSLQFKKERTIDFESEINQGKFLIQARYSPSGNFRWYRDNWFLGDHCNTSPKKVVLQVIDSTGVEISRREFKFPKEFQLNKSDYVWRKAVTLGKPN
jgi:hypothetical protein